MDRTSDFKICKNGTNCKHPDGPALPLSEFYHRNRLGELQNSCKECAKVYRRTRTNRDKAIVETWRPAEQEVINHLRSIGIYATSGVASQWNWVDVVAWGCVRIEVKTSNIQDGRFQFNLCPKIRANWHKNDLLLFVCRWESAITYHLFPVDFDLFYRDDGSIKDHLTYIPNPKFRHNKPVLTPEIMSAYQDNWGLIEDRRRAWGLDTKGCI